MDVKNYIQNLVLSPFYKGQIEHIETIPERGASYGELERPLHPTLACRLQEMGLSRLYAHQAEAINAARDGEHVTVITSTASGKTLCYNIPVLNAVLEDSASRALYLFPTKALAHDQLGKLNDFGLFPEVKFATYDGDTPATERRYIKRGAHIVLTNPDMLHIGILPYHTSSRTFFVVLCDCVPSTERIHS